MAEPTSEWEDVALDAGAGARDRGVSDEPAARRPRLDRVPQHRARSRTCRQAAPELRAIDLERPLIGLLTNVAWDAQLHYPANAFADMLDWIVRTVRYFAARPDLQLLIRVHPAEIAGDMPSRQPVVGRAAQAHSRAPAQRLRRAARERDEHLRAAEAVRRRDHLRHQDRGRADQLGMPVIVAGEAWIRNKGLTTDAASADDYFRILDRLPFRAPDARDRRSARPQVRLPLLLPPDDPDRPGRPRPGASRSSASPSTASTICCPERAPGLDVICDGILRGTPFVYPAERLGAGPR